MKNRLASIIPVFLAIPVFIYFTQKPAQHKQNPAPAAQTAAIAPAGKIVLQQGDILFQSSEGGQGKAIQIATGSKYNHCGMLYIKGPELYVLEANGPVGLTEYTDFINRGNGHFVIKRLKNRDKYFNDSIFKVFRAEGDKYIGTLYDPYFEWTDKQLYCSELVWKIYNRVLGIEVGKLQQLKEFNLNHPIVQAKLAERFGKNIPYEEKVISPAAIFDSDLLETVQIN